MEVCLWFFDYYPVRLFYIFLSCRESLVTLNYETDRRQVFLGTLAERGLARAEEIFSTKLSVVPKTAGEGKFRNSQLVRKIGENAHKSRAFYGLGQFALVKRANARSSFGHDP